MVFSSLAFLFFFLPLSLLCYYLSHNRHWRNIVLLIFSLFFYAWGEPLYVIIMIVSTLLNWLLASCIARWPARGKLLLVAGLLANFAGIAVFKYAGFLWANVCSLLRLDYAPLRIALPIGISFYTFQAVSYLMDVYRKTIRPQPNPLFFGTYLTMFPQLIAGPIVRYQTIEREILERRESLSEFSAGVRRFIIGLGKKVILANTMGYIADSVLSAGSGVGAIPAWYGLLAYTFQIYFDFSGYSDMAIGLGRMFGFHFLENFNYPYIARSITDFWRRWHISLSSFFRDYVYIPMGGNRVAPVRWIFNLLLIWSLTGLWHGASWNFVCWGAYYGILLIGEKMVWGNFLKKRPIFCQRVYTLAIVLFGWVIFRIEDFSLMGSWAAALAGSRGFGQPLTLNTMNILHLFPWFFICAVASTPYPTRLVKSMDGQRFFGWAGDAALACMLLLCVISLAVNEFNPFIYFRF